MSEAKDETREHNRLAGVWYNLTVTERWNVPILLVLFAVLIGAGLVFAF
jgi:hypothetical protein